MHAASRTPVVAIGSGAGSGKTTFIGQPSLGAVSRGPARLMQQAMTAQAIAIKDIVSQTTRAALSPLEQEVLSMRFGSLSNMRNIVLRGHLQSMMQDWTASPASAYRDVYKSSLVPLSARMSMLNQAPLAALGLGPLSWRNAEVTRAPLKLPPGAVKSVGGMAIS